MKPGRERGKKNDNDQMDKIARLLSWQPTAHGILEYAYMMYFDVKFQVLVHGINVVEDIVDNSGDHSHHVWVF